MIRQLTLNQCLVSGGPFDGSLAPISIKANGEPEPFSNRVYNPLNPFGETVAGRPMFVAIYRWDGRPRAKVGPPFRFVFVESIPHAEYLRRGMK